MLNIGTISHGTLRPQDLLISFSEAYKQYCSGCEEGYSESLYDLAQDWAYHLENADDLTPNDYEIVDGVLDDLIGSLEAIASRYDCYFGTTEGDGSDFGFWPNEGGEA